MFVIVYVCFLQLLPLALGIQRRAQIRAVIEAIKSKSPTLINDESKPHLAAVRTLLLIHGAGTTEQRRGYFTKEQKCVLYTWLVAHVEYPYPSERELSDLVSETAMTRGQVTNWLGNTRKRDLVRYICICLVVYIYIYMDFLRMLGASANVYLLLFCRQ